MASPPGRPAALPSTWAYIKNVKIGAADTDKTSGSTVVARLSPRNEASFVTTSVIAITL